MPGEDALWRYKRGAARAALGRTDEALADLTVASGADSQNWVHGRARVEMGRLALKRGDRNEAGAGSQAGRNALRTRQRSGLFRTPGRS